MGSAGVGTPIADGRQGTALRGDPVAHEYIAAEPHAPLAELVPAAAG